MRIIIRPTDVPIVYIDVFYVLVLNINSFNILTIRNDDDDDEIFHLCIFLL